MELIKISDPTCEVCKALTDVDDEVAALHELLLTDVTLAELVQNDYSFKKYVVEHHVHKETGEIDLPLYLVIGSASQVMISGAVRNEEELRRLLETFKDAYSISA
jgi:hypothetical protein